MCWTLPYFTRYLHPFCWCYNNTKPHNDVIWSIWVSHSRKEEKMRLFIAAITYMITHLMYQWQVERVKKKSLTCHIRLHHTTLSQIMFLQWHIPSCFIPYLSSQTIICKLAKANFRTNCWLMSHRHENTPSIHFHVYSPTPENVHFLFSSVIMFAESLT